MTNKQVFFQLALAFSFLIACGSKNANAGNDSAQTNQQEAAASTEEVAKNNVSIDGISQFVAWDMGAMSVSKEGDLFVIKGSSGHLTLYLKSMGDGVYQETSGKHDMIGQSARFVAEKVGDVTTLTAYSDKMMLFTVFDCDDLIAYRNKAYRRILKSRFEPTDDGVITITDDKMSGPILPIAPNWTISLSKMAKGT